MDDLLILSYSGISPRDPPILQGVPQIFPLFTVLVSPVSAVKSCLCCKEKLAPVVDHER